MKFNFLIFFLLLTKLVFSQCENADFEYGNFTNWTGRRGFCCPIVLPTNGITNGRQTIMTQGIDPNSCGGLNMVYQGNFSARLGNSSTGSRAESLRYSFLITPSNTMVQYAYAVVLQDPGHLAGEQPRFQSRVRTQNGTIIPCTEYTVTAGPNLPNFNYCAGIDQDGNPTNIAWSNWVVVSLDLSSYIGQTVSLEFETGDCDLGAHFGYAYIDAISCGPINSEIYYCSNINQIQVTAPNGFLTYNWEETGETTNSITIPTNVFDTLHVDVTTMTGCGLELLVILEPYEVLPNIVCSDNCFGESNLFLNLTENLTSEDLIYLWDFGDGTFSNEISPTHTYNQTGNFIVTLTITINGTTCIYQIQCNVDVYDVPTQLNIISHD
jgi:hypothetical protein